MLSSYLASLLATLANTVLVLGTMLLFYNGRAIEGGFSISFSWLLIAVAGINAVIEIAVIPILTAPCVAVLFKLDGKSLEKNKGTGNREQGTEEDY
jgi:ribose/xylose/arabinose/galactoside ABC-type transport system permease subunit